MTKNPIRSMAPLLILAGWPIGCGVVEGSQPASTIQQAPTLLPQASGTTNLLQAVSVVDDQVVWLSGHGGTYVRTVDGGGRWIAAVVPGADTLQFRDVHAVDAETAYLLSAGSGALSRIYKTTDGGNSWTLQFVNEEPEGFYDCLDFWDSQRGIAYGDAVDGELRILITGDGGEKWNRLTAEALPAALPGEGGFAASGTCAITGREGRAWIATGAGSSARVLRTVDWGRTWTAAATPVVSGNAAGLMTLGFWDDRSGVALGGDLGDPEGFTDNVVASDDGGITWQLAARPPFPGAVYGSALVPGSSSPSVVAVGPGGAAVSSDGARTWTSLDSQSYWAVGAASRRAVWMVGPEGRITKGSLR